VLDTGTLETGILFIATIGAEILGLDTSGIFFGTGTDVGRGLIPLTLMMFT
jgi:hypothetical protein